MTPPTQQASEPAWKIATLFPDQGDWSEGEYLALNTNHLVEFSDGYVEVLPMPTELHQIIVVFLFDILRSFIGPANLGFAPVAPLRVRLRPGKIREPDIVFLRTENLSQRGNRYWSGADLVMEVVSEDEPERDYVEKREDYAKGGVAEYWIVDPQRREVVVLKLTGNQYDTHGTFQAGDTVTSHLLEGFAVPVDAIFPVRDSPGA